MNSQLSAIAQLLTTITSIGASLTIIVGWAPEFLIVNAIPILLAAAFMSIALLWIPRKMVKSGVLGRSEKTEVIGMPIKVIASVAIIVLATAAIWRIHQYDVGTPTRQSEKPTLGV